jgi:simple sugar transport system permease protein
VNKKKLLDKLFDQKVAVLFALLCIGGIAASGQPMTFVAGELFTRVARNSFLVLSLIIPVLAGMGLNFGIVIGAMAAQIALFLTTYWGLSGIGGFLATVLLTTPLAVFFGFLVGKLFNKIKGSEMIGGLVLGYFAEGFYQLVFLFVFGGVIPFTGPNAQKLMLSTGVGVKNTIDLKDTIKYSLDTVSMLSIAEIAFYLTVGAVVLSAALKLWKKQPVNWKKTGGILAGTAAVYAVTFLPAVEEFLAADRLLLLWAVEAGVLLVILRQLFRLLWGRAVKKEQVEWKAPLAVCAAALILYALTYVPAVYEVLVAVKLPVMTYLCIGALCLFNRALMRTRLGQNMRTVGQSRVVAGAAGIDVDRTRVTAMILSTVLASWGQLIFLQNVGTFSTYGAHTQVGQFAIASLLVGGASVQKATNGQAILGVILFHTLFIVAPLAGRELFGNAMIGEYFRVFVSFGVIAMALAMHAWKKPPKPAPATPREDPPAAPAGKTPA